jgi:hypothetical protein
MKVLANEINELRLLIDDKCVELLKSYQIYLMHCELEKLPIISQHKLDIYHRAGIVKYLSLKTIMYEQILDLRNQHGEGATILELCKISFCRINQVKIITNDKLITHIADAEAIPVASWKEFRMMMEAKSRSKEKPKFNLTY